MKELLDISKAGTPRARRKKILQLEEALKALPNCKYMDDIPLVHRFVDGMYIREITIPGGMALTTHIHKTDHVAIISKGKVTIYSEEGEETVEAPHTKITSKGTKRAIYTHSEVVWTTVHRINETDVDKVLDAITFKDFEECDKFLEENKLCQLG